MKHPLNRLALLALAVGLLMAGPARSDDWLDDTPPGVARAQEAYNAALKRAEETYLTSQKSARQAYIKSLDVELRAASAAGKTNHVNNLKALREKLTREIDELDLKLKGPSSLKSFTVDALIDGNSELWLTPTGLYWKSLGGATKPGLHQGANAPTYINGTAWNPVWKATDNDTAPDTSDTYKLELGQPNFTVKIIAIAGDPSVKDPTTLGGTDQRDPITTRNESTNQVFTIPDTQSGSRWYRLQFTRK